MAYEKEYFNEIPEVFMKRGGIDRRGHYGAATIELIRFMESDAPYCLLTYETSGEAKRAANSAGTYAKKHNLGCRASMRDIYVLFIKETA